MTDVSVVPTPHGDARLFKDRSRSPIATLLLGHGAGGGVDSRDLVALAEGLPRNGISVVRVEQPWHVAGKKIAPRPQVLDECFVAAADKLRVRTPARGRRPQRGRPVGRADGEAARCGRASSRWPSPCTRRATRSAPGSRSWRRWTSRCWCPGGEGRVRDARGVPGPTTT